MSTDERISIAEEIVYARTISSSLIKGEKSKFSKGEKRDKVKINYQVIQRFKGEENNVGIVYEGHTNCSLGISTGRPYIFFIRGKRFVSRCNGSRLAYPNNKLLLELRTKFKQKDSLEE